MDIFVSNHYVVRGQELVGVIVRYNDTVDILTSKYFERATYVDKLQKVDYFCDLLNVGYMVDIDNKQYSKTCEFPHMISIIDGNFITSCILGNKIYIFYSYTEDYESGVFIYDIDKNIFNTSDIYNENGTNRFKNLHNKNITGCCVDKDKIILNIRDIELNNNTISVYDPITDTFTENKRTMDFHDIKIHNGVIYGFNWNTRNLIYRIDSSIIIGCEQDEIILFWTFNDNQLIIIYEKYENPFGQIYQNIRQRHCKLKYINLNKL